MTSLFKSLTTYAGKWSVKQEIAMDAEDKAMYRSAKVVSSNYGKSVCFILKAGGMNFIPLSTEGKQLNIGDNVDFDNCVIQVLAKDGEADIYRVKINN